MRILAEKTGCCVIGVNYVLAPEAKFPSQILETVEVVRYFHQHAAEWGLDGNDISMAGDSGGATLIFAAMLYLRDEYKEGKDYLTSLLLYYGMYGMRDGVSGGCGATTSTRSSWMAQVPMTRAISMRRTSRARIMTPR